MDGLPIDYSAYFRPSLPTIECVISESNRYNIPLPVTLALMKTEGGRPGDVIANKNGTYDLGVMQVNTVHLGAYAKRTGLQQAPLKVLLAANGCFSVSVGLDILSQHVRKTGSLVSGVMAYHSKTPHLAERYIKKFNKNLELVQSGSMPAMSGALSSIHQLAYLAY